eukprot:scaffold4893_cov256-Amphora_coffeaeformis.AAC.1
MAFLDAPSRMRILENVAHFFLAFFKFWKRAGQSLLVEETKRPRYLKALTQSSVVAVEDRDWYEELRILEYASDDGDEGGHSGQMYCPGGRRWNLECQPEKLAADGEGSSGAKSADCRNAVKKIASQITR